MVEIYTTIDIDFREGMIEGDFELGEVTRLDMAVVFEQIAQQLRDTPDPVAFVNYDCGIIRIG